MTGASWRRLATFRIWDAAAVLIAGAVVVLWALVIPSRWSEADFNLFPQSVHVYIATEAGVDAGDVLDVESGAASPAETESWIRKRKAAGATRHCMPSITKAASCGGAS